MVTDANGCILNLGPYIIAEPAPLALAVSTTDATGPNTPDGSATATATGGTAPYSYAWSGGGNSNLLPGNYSVVVTDANGCIDSTAFTIGSTMSISSEAFGFNLYPNPASAQVQVDLSGLSGLCQLRILDSRGRTLTSFKVEGGQRHAVEVVGLSAGVYLVEIQNGENSYRQRLILRP